MKNFFDKYELYTDDESIYCYPNTFVLKNKLDIKDYDTLKFAESDFVSARLFELQSKSMKGHFDKEHLYKIHTNTAMWSESQKDSLSSDRGLQPAHVKSELLVIPNQHVGVNAFPGLVHTARHAMGVGSAQSR